MALSSVLKSLWYSWSPVVLSRCLQHHTTPLKSSRSTVPAQQRLDTFLLISCNAPNSTTKEPLAMLFLNHKLGFWLDLLKPSVAGAVHRSQDSQEQHCQKHSKAMLESLLVEDMCCHVTHWTSLIQVECRRTRIMKTPCGSDVCMFRASTPEDHMFCSAWSHQPPGVTATLCL